MESTPKIHLIFVSLILSCWCYSMIYAQSDLMQAIAKYIPKNSTDHEDWNPMFKKMMAGLLTVGQGGPAIYDMSRNGSSLGINVLSGLVKIDRQREPGKPRALSVRVFGMPVFTRGYDSANPNSDNAPPKGEEEDLPLDP